MENVVMTVSNQGLQDLAQSEYRLFGELLDCLNKERESLMDLNVGHLWSVMEEKKRILEAIEEAQNHIKELRSKRLDHDMPLEDRRAFHNLTKKINHRKQEVRTRVRENASFIQETLAFFDEIVSILLTGGDPNWAYPPKTGSPKDNPPRIYRKEV
jgi:hypothetical protein